MTADGEIIVASETEHPDLFWAISGGGGNFGIATLFTLGLVPVSQIVGGMLVFPAEPQILTEYARVALAAPDELTTITQVMKTPPIPFLSPDLYGKVHFHVMVCYTGSPEEAESALAPLTSIGPVLGRMVVPMPYPAIFKFTGEATVPHAISVRNHFLNDLNEDAARTIIESSQNTPSPVSMVQIRALGGQMARVPSVATAFAHREAPIIVAIIEPWVWSTDPQVATHKAWTEDLWQKLQAYSAGAYIGFQGDEGSNAEQAGSAYPLTTYSWLARIKEKYDPENFFKTNQNIVPAN